MKALGHQGGRCLGHRRVLCEQPVEGLVSRPLLDSCVDKALGEYACKLRGWGAGARAQRRVVRETFFEASEPTQYVRSHQQGREFIHALPSP